MFLDLNNQDYISEIFPYIHRGIIIDTSVLDILVNGVIETHISKRKCLELENLLLFLDLIKIGNRWEKFFITPHILTEVCTHFKNKYNQWSNYNKIVEEIIPIIKDMKELNVVCKDKIIDYIDLKIPVLEIGDISICLTVNDIDNQKEKIAILTCDSGFNKKFQDNKNVLIMDYKQNLLNRY